MKTIWKVLIAVILIVFIGVLLTWYYSEDVDVKSIIKNEMITFSDSRDKIYTSARAWGLAGNHREIVLSSVELSNEHRAYSKEECYIFYTPSIYYKIEKGGRLIVYVNESSVSEPTNFKSNIVIKIEGLKTAKQLNEYAENYEKYGLKKISIFDE